ncbi:MAG: uracil-DNA glycosylase, partial [Candidatus Nanoarchaeia archaeon]
ELKENYNNCALCPALKENRTNVVFGVGNPEKAKIVIIGEAPGKMEDLKNEPFVGRSGQVLTSLLNEIGLSREEVYITNTILCRPPNNRNPNKGELDNCRPRLDKQLEILNPKVVITLGNFATKYMLQTKEGITSIHGQIFEKDNMKIVPMFHPAVLLYNGNSPEKRKELLNDFMVVKDLIGE